MLTVTSLSRRFPFQHNALSLLRSTACLCHLQNEELFVFTVCFHSQHNFYKNNVHVNSTCSLVFVFLQLMLIGVKCLICLILKLVWNIFYGYFPGRASPLPRPFKSLSSFETSLLFILLMVLYTAQAPKYFFCTCPNLTAVAQVWGLRLWYCYILTTPLGNVALQQCSWTI